MKFWWVIFLALSCTYEEDPGKDYVLVEFASKLEEDHQKLLPPEEKSKQD